MASHIAMVHASRSMYKQEKKLLIPSVIGQGEGCCSAAIISQQFCRSLLTIATTHEQNTPRRVPDSVGGSLLAQDVGLLPAAV